MLTLSLEPEEYITIGDSIVVKVCKMARGRCFLSIDADRSIPIVRSAVLERKGTPPPACLADLPPKRKPRCKPGGTFRWNADRERAVRQLRKVADRLEAGGSGQEAQILRMQLEQIVPAVWEEETVSSG